MGLIPEEKRGGGEISRRGPFKKNTVLCTVRTTSPSKILQHFDDSLMYCSLQKEINELKDCASCSASQPYKPKENVKKIKTFKVFR